MMKSFRRILIRGFLLYHFGFIAQSPRARSGSEKNKLGCDHVIRFHVDSVAGQRG